MNFKGLKLFLLIWCSSGFTALFAQSQDYKKRFDSNERIFYKYANKDLKDSALKYLNISQSIATESKNHELQALFYLQNAHYYKLKDAHELLIANSRKAFSYFKFKKDVANELEAAFLIASHFYAVADYDSALYYCTKYIPIALKLKDT